MIRKLRIKMTLLVIASLGAVLLMLNIANIAAMKLNFRASAYKTLRYIAEKTESAEKDSPDMLLPGEEAENSEKEDPGKMHSYASGFGFGAKITKETEFETRYFTVSADENGNIISSDLSHIAEISRDNAEKMAKSVLKTGSDEGSKYNYRYIVRKSSDGTAKVYFLNCTATLRLIFFQRFIVFIISAAFLAAMCVVVWIASKWIVKPFADNLATQKQFITNAGHELKTPIAIIAANTEVLRMINGDNEWLTSIQNQTNRLSKLVSRLVSLSKANEKSSDVVFEKFCISDAVIDTNSAFAAPAKAKNIKVKEEVEPDIYVTGDERNIRQLCEILVENAVKYCLDGGEITVCLKTKSKSVHLDVSNTCEPPDKKKLDRLFDRFYRADYSRSRETGGYGIGLSIAKAIVEKHKGKISVSAKDDLITFSVVL